MPPRVTAIAVATIDLSGRWRTPHPSQPTKLLAGAALLHHRLVGDQLLFSLQSKTLLAGEVEIELIDWLEDELTLPGLITGYSLEAGILPMLASCSTDTQHIGLAAIQSTEPCNLADLTRLDGAGRVIAFEDVCSREWIEVARADPARDQHLWANDGREHLDAILRSRALATWHLWLSDYQARTNEIALCLKANQTLHSYLQCSTLPTASTFGHLISSDRKGS